MKKPSLVHYNDMAVIIKTAFAAYANLSSLISPRNALITREYIQDLESFIVSMGSAAGIEIEFDFLFEVKNKEQHLGALTELLLNCNRAAYVSHLEDGEPGDLPLLDWDSFDSYDEIYEIPSYSVGVSAYYAVVSDTLASLQAGPAGFNSAVDARVCALVVSLKETLERFGVLLHPHYPAKLPKDPNVTAKHIKHALGFGNTLFGDREACRDILSELNCEGTNGAGDRDRSFSGVSVFIDIAEQYLFDANAATVTVSEGAKTDVELPGCKIIHKSSQLTEKFLAKDAAFLLLKVANDLADHFGELPDDLISNYDKAINGVEFKDEFRAKFKTIANKLNAAFSKNMTIVAALERSQGFDAGNDLSHEMVMRP